MILEGPSGPKLRTEALVASEKVGDDGREFSAPFGDSARERSERGRGMSLVELVACDGVKRGYGGERTDMGEGEDTGQSMRESGTVAVGNCAEHAAYITCPPHHSVIQLSTPASQLASTIPRRRAIQPLCGPIKQRINYDISCNARSTKSTASQHSSQGPGSLHSTRQSSSWRTCSWCDNAATPTYVSSLPLCR